MSEAQSFLFGRPKREAYLLLIPILLASALAIVDLAACSRDTATTAPRRPAVSFGTSSLGSAFYSLSIGMADILTRNTGISVTVEPVGGSDANMRSLRDGKVDLAMLNSHSVVAGFSGTGQFAEDGKIRVALVAQGQLSLRQIVARKASAIETPFDLTGKRFIAHRRALSDIARFREALLKAYNLSEDKVTILETAETNEAIEALKIGSADAAILPGGVPASFLTDLSQTTDVHFVSITDDRLKIILKDLGPAFVKGVIPAETYRGQDTDVTVPAMRAVLIASPKLSPQVVYELTRALMTNSEKIQAVHSAGKEWTVENSLSNPPIPFHPGAARYYKEVGAWRSELQELQ